jgi:hypothetical protein
MTKVFANVLLYISLVRFNLDWQWTIKEDDWFDLQCSPIFIIFYNNSKRLSISFLNARNRDFGETLPSKACLNDYVNIVIIYS